MNMVKQYQKEYSMMKKCVSGCGKYADLSKVRRNYLKRGEQRKNGEYLYLKQLKAITKAMNELIV